MNQYGTKRRRVIKSGADELLEQVACGEDEDDEEMDLQEIASHQSPGPEDGLRLASHDLWSVNTDHGDVKQRCRQDMSLV